MFIFLKNLFFALSVTHANASPACTSVMRDEDCAPLTAQQEFAVDMCKAEMKAAHCDEYFEKNPSMATENRKRNCESLVTCPTANKLADYTAACIENWGAAWSDVVEGWGKTAVSIGTYMITNTGMSPEIQERESFFTNCTSIECKRKILGPYVDLFTKEEIEGHPNPENLDPNKPENQNYLHGLSAKVLYKKLLERMHEKMVSGGLNQPLLEPWSGKPAKPLQTVNEMIETALTNAGVVKTECYDPTVLAKMRCYAFFTIIDPLVTVAGVAAIGKAAGLVGKVETATSKEAALLKARQKAEKKAQKYIPIKSEDTVKSSEILKHYEDQKKELKKLGVGFKETDTMTVFEADVRFRGRKVDENIESDIEYGKVLEVETLPPPSKSTSPFVNAFKHPEMATYKKKLEEMGYKLVVDTSNKIMGYGGYQWGETMVLSLTPNATWQAFVHEFQHVEFSQFVSQHYQKMGNIINEGKTLRSALPQKVQAQIGTEKLAKIETLMKKGISETAVNEALSVGRELEALGFRQYIPGVGSSARQYALKYQISDLESKKARGLELTPVQKKTLSAAKVEYHLLTGRDFALGGTAAAVAGVGGGTAVIVIYNNITGEVISKKSDGTYRYTTLGAPPEKTVAPAPR